MQSTTFDIENIVTFEKITLEPVLIKGASKPQAFIFNYFH